MWFEKIAESENPEKKRAISLRRERTGILRLRAGKHQEFLISLGRSKRIA